MNIAVILAGGSGTRMGAQMPKQFLKVGGKTILEHSVDAFERNDRIDEVVVVSRPDFVDDVKTLVLNDQHPKVRQVLAGGKERYDSSLAAINAYTNDADNLLLHDAVRPMVCQRIIDECLTQLERYRAVDVAIRATDTIIRVDDAECICEIPPRVQLRQCQTPQGFRRGLIKQAYDVALADPHFQATDDCSVVHKYLPAEPIKVVEGDTMNIKITYPQDVALLEQLLQIRI